MNFSGFAFLAAEFSTSSRIFATALSESGRTTSARTAPPSLTQPASISSPIQTVLSMLSPVMDLVSSAASRPMRRQSAGSLSPFLSRMISPGTSSSGSTSSGAPSLRRMAVSHLSAMSLVIALRDEPTARRCKYSPI